MSPILDIKNETAMEASTSKDHTAFVLPSKDKNMKPDCKHEGQVNMGILSNKQDVGVCNNEGVEVDIINCKNDDEGGSVQLQSDDVTASSSSFGDTFSDRRTCESDSDNEVISDLRGDAAPVCGFGGSGDLFPLRKKRVTSHWRKFVQPIMWRCKWVELQLRKFESMAIMYDKEIEKHNQTKQLKYKNFEIEGRSAKSMPFFNDSQRQKPMKRKIRKRREESNTEVYKSLHNIFSYFATCRFPAHGPTMDDDQSNLAPSSPNNIGNEFRVPDELSLDFRDGYSLEQILWKIEVAQSQVSKIKNRLDAVTTENAGRISSTEDLILHQSNNTMMLPVSEQDFPTDREGPSIGATFASQLMKLKTGDDMVKPENAVSEFTHVQDANEPIEQRCVASRKRTTDGILIYNRRAKKPQGPQPDSATIEIHPIEKLRVPKEENNNNNTAPVSVSEDPTQKEQPAPKIGSISKLTSPKNKKRRAARTRRKSGSSLWSLRTSG